MNVWKERIEFAYFLALLIFLILLNVDGRLEITNVDCQPIDKSFADFEYCFIRAVNRSYKYISIKVNLFKVPINNVTVRVDTRKRANGFKPFLYNISVDACKFLRSKTNPLVYYFYAALEGHSNMNHTCPFNHDLILDKMDSSYLNNRMTSVLPFPEGEYAIFTTWSAYNKPRANVNFYLSLR